MRAIELYKTEGVNGIGKGTERYIHHHALAISRYVYGSLVLHNIRNLKEDLTPDASIDYVNTKCYSLITPTQAPSEILRLVTMVRERKPGVILEIGTATGGTLFLFARNAPKSCRLISIDLPDGPYGGGYPEWKIPLYKAFALPGQSMQLFRADSHDNSTLGKIKAITPGGIDFLFIDGDHIYDGVKTDYEMYGHLVNKGGMIAFHDIVVHPAQAECDVNHLWNEVKQKYPHEEIVENWNQGGYGIGVLYK